MNRWLLLLPSLYRQTKKMPGGGEKLNYQYKGADCLHKEQRILAWILQPLDVRRDLYIHTKCHIKSGPCVGRDRREQTCNYLSPLGCAGLWEKNLRKDWIIAFYTCSRGDRHVAYIERYPSATHDLFAMFNWVSGQKKWQGERLAKLVRQTFSADTHTRNSMHEAWLCRYIWDPPLPPCPPPPCTTLGARVYAIRRWFW